MTYFSILSSLKLRKTKKNQNSFQRNHFTTSQILWLLIESLKKPKHLGATQVFVDFSKAFNFIHRGKIEQILLAYGLPKETVTAIMMLYKNNGLLNWWRHQLLRHRYWSFARRYISNIFVYNLLRLCTSNTNKSNKRKWFHIKKARSRWYPTNTMTDADYADYLELLTNTPAQAESLLHSLEETAGGISLYMNANKTEYICIKQKGAISTQMASL